MTQYRIVLNMPIFQALCCWRAPACEAEISRGETLAHAPQETPNALYSDQIIAPESFPVLHQAPVDQEADLQVHIHSASSDAENKEPTNVNATPPTNINMAAEEARNMEPASGTPSALNSAQSSVPRVVRLPWGPWNSPKFNHETREMIRRAYEEPDRSPNPFMIDRYGNRLPLPESIARIVQMYHGEGGPLHPRQVALRMAEPSEHKRHLLFRDSMLLSYNKLVRTHFGPSGGSSSQSRSTVKKSESSSLLQSQQVAIIHNNDDADGHSI